MTDKLGPPKVNELEVTVFGGVGGYGESCLVHIGNNKWVIIDSCVGEAKAPSALAKLNDYGVEPAEAVVLVVVTHWHDDHIRGISEVVRNCPGAGVVLSSALTEFEFLRYLARFGEQRDIQGGSRVSEFNAVFDIIQKNKEQGSKVPKRAIADRCLENFSGLASSASGQGRIVALSPADFQVERFLRYVASDMPVQQETRRAAPAVSENDAAIAIWVDVGDVAVLLGSDLVEHGSCSSGWSAVLASKGRPHGVASLFKVPHHGASSAHHEHVWEKMLTPNCLSLLTPFARGAASRKLPSSEDIARINSLTNEAYVTSEPLFRKWAPADSMVRRSVREAGVKLSSCQNSGGYLTARSGPPSARKWTLHKGETAVALAERST